MLIAFQITFQFFFTHNNPEYIIVFHFINIAPGDNKGKDIHLFVNLNRIGMSRKTILQELLLTAFLVIKIL